MVSQSYHRRRCALPPFVACPFRSGQTQALVVPIEVVGTAHQVHPGCQHTLLMSDGPTTVHQRGQATAKRGIQPFNVGGIDVIAPFGGREDRGDGLCLLTNYETAKDRLRRQYVCF